MNKKDESLRMELEVGEVVEKYLSRHRSLMPEGWSGECIEIMFLDVRDSRDKDKRYRPLLGESRRGVYIHPFRGMEHLIRKVKPA